MWTLSIYGKGVEYHWTIGLGNTSIAIHTLIVEGELSRHNEVGECHKNQQGHIISAVQGFQVQEIQSRTRPIGGLKHETVEMCRIRSTFQLNSSQGACRV